MSVSNKRKTRDACCLAELARLMDELSGCAPWAADLLLRTARRLAELQNLFTNGKHNR